MQVYRTPILTLDPNAQAGGGMVEVVKLADAQATVDLAKAEGAAEVRKVIQQRLIDVRLARSVARLSFAQDEYDAQISALESILKQCEEP